jgi:superfamily II DNA or RNA helicase
MAKTKNPGPETIWLPAITFGPERYSIGYVSHVLQNSGDSAVVEVTDVQVSPRRKEKLYRFSDGQSIIITKRKQLARPADVDGVLSQYQDQPKWISHRRLEEFKQDVISKGLDKKRDEISEGWIGKFVFQSELKDSSGNVIRSGLRPPQIGGLHAIGAHWSLYQHPATIVMPTGTGKTETMLATLVAYTPGAMLVAVPSKVLRDQTAKKFLTLGLLRALGNLAPDVGNPIVGVITRRPKSTDDFAIFDHCNVVVATMSALAEESSTNLVPELAKRIGALIVDEAHHIAAKGWAAFREQFTNNKVLQFTATPYRRDGKLVDGKVLYEYPLQSAQLDGYFKKISFEPIYEIDDEAGDRAIAAAAIKRLQEDMAAGFDHLIMARCGTITRAKDIYDIYNDLAPELNPLIFHSETDSPDVALAELRSGKSRIVVCVNMLGEGFDLPQLKIAAVHDTHKSLAVLLQFTGRFTRSSGANIGNATVIANIANADISSALDRLYSEDANWNQLLSEFSSEAAKSHTALVTFLNESKRLDESDEDESVEISHHLLHPKQTTVVYDAPEFHPKDFFKALSRNVDVHRVWLHTASNTLYFVTRTEPSIPWTRSKELKDRQWDLFVLHWDAARKLLFLASSDLDSTHEVLAKAVGATSLITGDTVFRVLGRINRLIFQNVGVKKHGRRNLRYAMYTGADVAEALSISEKAGSVKSNLSGTGWENGKPVAIGCSYKGRVWSRDQGTVPDFVRWCALVGDKLQDVTINTSDVIKNVLIPQEVDKLPDGIPLSIEWPVEILNKSEEHVNLTFTEGVHVPISLFDLAITGIDVSQSELDFQISGDTGTVSLRLKVGGDKGFEVSRLSPTVVRIRIGSLEIPVEEYLSNYPPLVRFIDLSELDGNLLIRPQAFEKLVFPPERFEVWDWKGVDFKKESIWKTGTKRENSIQWRAAKHFIDGGLEVVFDDDSAGEAADLVCLKEETDSIRLCLVHCKFAGGKTAGERISDVVEVCSQAVRSSKWKWKFRDLARHIVDREKRLMNHARGTRFLAGNTAMLNRLVKISRFKEIRAEIIIVQPGISESSYTPDQVAVLAAAQSYLKETIGVDLDVVCSA